VLGTWVLGSPFFSLNAAISPTRRQTQRVPDCTSQRFTTQSSTYVTSRSHHHVPVYPSTMVDQRTVNWTSTGSPVARYLHGLNIDEPLAMLRSSVTSYYEADGLGSITSLSNSSGSIANTYSYNSFGNLTASTGSLTNPFQFTAREHDESGLYFYRARYYDPSSGRFLSEDPIGLAGGDVNSYNYAASSPTNFVDPSGLDYTTSKSAVGPAVYVNASITMYGEGASARLAEKWQKWITETWNNNPGFGKCRVFFNVQVIADPRATSWRNAMSDPNFPGANNYIYVPAGSPSDLGNPHINFTRPWSFSTGIIPSGTLSFTVSHEFGHLLHLLDSKFGGRNINPLRPSDDIMNEGFVVSQYDINRIIGNQCGCE